MSSIFKNCDSYPTILSNFPGWGIALLVKSLGKTRAPGAVPNAVAGIEVGQTPFHCLDLLVEVLGVIMLRSP